MKKLFALILLSLLGTSSLATAASLPIINDDYGKARAEATERKLPLLVDVWAPW